MQKTKKDWEKLLKRDLIQFPPHGREYHTPDTLIISVITKKNKYRRTRTFGGLYSATITFYEDKKYNDKFKVEFLSYLKKPFSIKFDEIQEINFKYLNQSFKPWKPK